MKRFVLMSILIFSPGLCFSKDFLNFTLLPDLFKCHQLGVEFAITEKSTLGLIGRGSCKSDRPTYGKSNDNVRNNFSRILVPWRYSKNGVFTDGYFVQSLVGLERSKFSSELGSSANVTFLNVAFQFGYQWFWSNGLNVSVMGGPAFLVESGSSKNIVINEQDNVVDFLNKNTKTNVHGGAGVIIGWGF